MKKTLLVTLLLSKEDGRGWKWMGVDASGGSEWVQVGLDWIAWAWMGMNRRRQEWAGQFSTTHNLIIQEAL